MQTTGDFHWPILAKNHSAIAQGRTAITTRRLAIIPENSIKTKKMPVKNWANHNRWN
jgi:hypothetical protein